MMPIKVEISTFVELNQDFLDSAHNMIIQAYNVDTSKNISHCSLSYVLSSVLLSVCFLEAFINSIYSQINTVERSPYLEPTIDRNTIIKDICKDFDIERKPILDKYDILLKYTKGINLNKGDNIYQNAKTLIRFRNQLVHFKAYWSDTENKTNKNKEELLKNRYRILKKEFEDGELFGFWRYPCACWALNTVLDFTEYFWNEMFPDKEYIYNYKAKLIRKSLSKMKWESKYTN